MRLSDRVHQPHVQTPGLLSWGGRGRWRMACQEREAIVTPFQMPTGGTSIMEAELSLPAVQVQVWRFDLRDSRQSILRQDRTYRLDLCLSPRPAGSGLCFADHWASGRFVRAGKLFLLPPSETLRVRSGVGRQDAIICHLPTDRVSDWLDSDCEWTDRRLEASLNIGEPVIENLLLQLGAEARHPGFAADVLSEAMTVQIAIQLERFYRGLSQSAAAGGGLAPWRLRLIDERLNEVQGAPTLSELASACRLSVRQLSRGFRVSRGVSIGDYVAKARIEQAKHLLCANKSVKSVAHAMGFASASSFSYAFRRSTGVAPSAYRSRP